MRPRTIGDNPYPAGGSTMSPPSVAAAARSMRPAGPFGFVREGDARIYWEAREPGGVETGSAASPRDHHAGRRKPS